MIHPAECNERVRYCETDRMGYFHHANYPLYFEIGRTEWLRKLGISYKEVEDHGVVMPVAEMNIKYFSPAFYDDEILIRTYLEKPPTVRITFVSEILRKSDNTLLCKGQVTLAFINKNTGKPVRNPEFMKGIEL